jgi:5'-nucleotidase
MTNRSLVVAIDMDEVVADLLSEWLRRYNLDYNDSLTLNDIQGWDLTHQTKAGKFFYDYLTQDDLYDHIKPINGALWTVDAIRMAGHRVVFVTSCVRGTVDAKFDWLRRYGFLPHANDSLALKDFYPVRDKSLINAHVLFDDGLHNVEPFPGMGVLVEHPHNRNETTTRYRVRFADTASVLFLIRTLRP